VRVRASIRVRTEGRILVTRFGWAYALDTAFLSTLSPKPLNRGRIQRVEDSVERYVVLAA
jgi:hypothetical protein